MALPYVVSAASLALLLFLLRGTLPQLGSELRSAGVAPLVFAGCFYLLALAVQSVRTALVSRFYGVRVPVHRFFLYTLVGLFFSNFIPSAVSGDVVKASYAAGASGRGFGAGLAAILVDRLIGLTGACLLASVAVLFFSWPGLSPAIPVLSGVLILVIVAGVVFVRFERVITPLRALSARFTSLAGPAGRFLAPTGALLRARTAMPIAFALTLVSLSVGATSLWLTGRAIELDLNYGTYLLLLPLAGVLAIVPSMNGAGVREAAFVVVLRPVIPEEKALALSLLFYALGVFCSVLGGLIFLARGPLGLRAVTPFRRASTHQAPR